VERGRRHISEAPARVPWPHELTEEEAARLETFIYDADDTGNPRGLLWWTVAGAGLGLGALIYGLWLAFDTWVLVP
jgi:hypothetical protein